MLDKKPVNQSVLDRLLDDAPGVSTEPAPAAHQSIRAMQRAVRRDLEALLNTRYRCVSAPAGLKELETSLVSYGLPDLTGHDLATAGARTQLARTMESTIRRFEPRFKSVRVSLLDNAEPLDRTLRFRIDAVLYAEPLPAPVVFDSTVEPVTGSVTVKDSSR